jgi:hypothetical protein
MNRNVAIGAAVVAALSLCLCLGVVGVGIGWLVNSPNLAKGKNSKGLKDAGPSKDKVASNEEQLSLEEKEAGIILTKKVAQDLNAIPLKAHDLLNRVLGGTLVQAQFMGQTKYGWSGGRYTPAIAKNWSGFYLGKEVGGNAKDKSIKLRSFTILTHTSYDFHYDVTTKLATESELKLLRQRGYIK